MKTIDTFLKGANQRAQECIDLTIHEEHDTQNVSSSKNGACMVNDVVDLTDE